MKLPHFEFDKKLWGNAALFMIVACVILSYAFVFIDGEPRRDDEYFHFKLAYNMRTEGWNVVQCFDAIYLNKGAENCGRYAVNLYNLSLIPFTYIQDHNFAIKIMDMFFAALTFTLIYVLMKKTRVRHAFLFSLLLLTFNIFVLRMLHGRAYVLLVALVLWEMYFGIEKKYKSLFVISLIHVLWHHATFFLPFVMIGIVESARFVVNRQVSYKNLGIAAAAIVCGKAFYPGFPGSMFTMVGDIFTIQQSSSSEAMAGSASIAGSELDKKPLMDYFFTKMFLLIMIVINACVAAFVFMSHRVGALDRHGISEKTVHWILSLFIFMTIVVISNFLISGRFDDFMVPVIVLLFAQVVTLLFDGKFIVIDKYIQTYLMAAACIILSFMLAQSIVMVKKTSNANLYPAAKQAALWIQERSEPDEKVFLHNWTDFTLMYFYNSDSQYSMGLEPNALKQYDEGLYWKYYNILRYAYYCDAPRDCQDEVNKAKQEATKMKPEEVAARDKENSKKLIESIKNDFKSKFVVSNSPALDQVLMRNPELVKEKWINNMQGMHYSAFELQ
jgi:hypothetical protein